MGVVHELSTEISNLIAAGEVVERPASVVKELVENSIDAGATMITVEIQNGGNTYIRIVDNGCGMEMEDARIAFRRHATSKIQTAADLDAIYTLGFRGEALSSIGAVAQVDLFTKRREDATGTHVICSGGEIVSCEETGAADGTTMIVRNLFFNMPARMKFLKKDATEAAYISDILTRFILAHPEISFRFLNNGKEQLFSSGDNLLKNCIYAVYGKQYANAILSVDYKTDLVHITGVVGTGEVARPNRTYQSFFVNRRYIKSPMMVRALEEAFKNRIMVGKFPMAALNIEINPGFIDINVHPTKLEVRFSDDSAIYRAVYHGVQNALMESVVRPAVERPETSFVADTATVREQMEIEIPKNWKDPIGEEVQEQPTTTARLKRELDLGDYNLGHKSDYFEKKQTQKFDAFMEQIKPQIRPQEPEGQPQATTTTEAEQVTDIKNIISQIVQKTTAEQATKQMPEQREESKPVSAEPVVEAEPVFAGQAPVRVIGQVFDTYILAEQNGQMLIIDQHAAHERLKFEELKHDLAKKSIHPQLLLVPVIIELSAVEYAIYEEQGAALEQLGFEIEAFGDKSIIVRATPQPIDEDALRQLVVEVLTNIGAHKNQVITEKDERLLYTIACKAAVKANHAMDKKELEALVQDVMGLENINTCPHGRPIVITMSKKELEKEFGRIV